MAAGDKIPLVCTAATHGTAAILGVSYAEIEIGSTEVDETQAAGAGGLGAGLETSEDVRATVFGNNPNALMAQKVAAKADLILKFKDGSGVIQQVTLTDFRFRKFGKALPLPPPDAGGKVAPWALAGRIEWPQDAVKTLADMVIWAVGI